MSYGALDSECHKHLQFYTLEPLLHNLFLSSNLDHLFNLRFAAKELSRNAKKCEKQEKEEKQKIITALKVTRACLERFIIGSFRKGIVKLLKFMPKIPLEREMRGSII